MTKTPPIIIDTIINAPIKKVWDALTHRRQMKHWFFDIEDFIPEFGAEFEFYNDADKKDYLHKGKITDMVLEQKIGYDWKYDGIEGDSQVTFELHPDVEGKTRLKLKHSGTESFPAYDNNLSRASFEKGWDQIINHNLKNYLEQ